MRKKKQKKLALNPSKPLVEQTCARCPAHKTASVPGEYYKGLWFCSHSCVLAYVDDEHDELLGDKTYGKEPK